MCCHGCIAEIIKKIYDKSIKILKPNGLKPGAKLGVFTPSSPAYIWNEGLFENGIQNLKRLGFEVKVGKLTQRRGALKDIAPEQLRIEHKSLWNSLKIRL